MDTSNLGIGISPNPGTYTIKDNYYAGPPWNGLGPKISAALVKAQTLVKDAGKSGDNKFDKYKYSKLEDFLGACDSALMACNLALSVETVDVINLPDRPTKNGGAEHAVQVRIRGTLIHDSGETHNVSGYGEGQDRADKAIYKAITGARKYLVAGLLRIATTDDPEADEAVGLAGKGGARQKLDSQGNEQTRIPKWTDQQKLEAGALNTSILALLTKQYGNAAPADEELGDWKHKHKYDAPSDVIDSLNAWKKELEA
jgi:hypothetical protein